MLTRTTSNNNLKTNSNSTPAASGNPENTPGALAARNADVKQTSPLLQLPDELLLNIFGRLDFGTHLQSRAVCKDFNVLLQDSERDLMFIKKVLTELKLELLRINELNKDYTHLLNLESLSFILDLIIKNWDIILLNDQVNDKVLIKEIVGLIQAGIEYTKTFKCYCLPNNENLQILIKYMNKYVDSKNTSNVRSRHENVGFITDPNINTKNKQHRTPLMWLAPYGPTEIAKLLIQCGADVNTVNRNNSTPLIVACLHSRKELIQLLLKSGANVQRANNFSQTAYETAAMLDNSSNEILELLRMYENNMGQNT